MAPSAEKLQIMLDVVANWCKRWGMQINAKKTQIMHIRNHQRPRSDFQFSCGGAPLDYTDTYKYLGYILHEHLSDQNNVEILTASASRSFGRIHSIFRSMGNMGIKSYETLYESYVNPILNYGSAVWGFKDFDAPRTLQNRIMRFFLGVHKFTPLASVRLEMDWIEPKEKRWLDMLRYFNRINTMSSNRLPRIVYEWDMSLGLNTWASEIQKVAANIGYSQPLNFGETFSIKDSYNTLLEQNRISWQSESLKKPKLRTYVKIHNFDSKQVIVRSNLTRYQRSLVTQLKMGILPLKFETDRYQGIPPENRLCKMCNLMTPEDEAHFMFVCPALDSIRVEAAELFDGSNVNLYTPDAIEKLSSMYNWDNIKFLGKYVLKLYKARQNIMYV